MIVVSCGMGTNTIAMLVGMQEKGIRPDLLLFADTGGEKPHTYQMVMVMNDWLEKHQFPLIETVKVEATTLEGDCLKRKALPAIAYGFKTCSQRFKLQPQRKFINNHPKAKEAWEAGEKVTMAIGFDYGEPQRARESDQPHKFDNWYPLIEWEWTRNECVAAIERAGLPQPGKSACFFCPNMRPEEIRELNAQYPDLARRAVEMERNADLTTIKGLGRRFAWENVIATDDLFDYPEIQMPCECMT